jgi:predicted nucleic acid-binding protein
VADFLVDTDVFVDHLRGARRFEAKSHRVHYSVVTRAELSAGNSATELVTISSPPSADLLTYSHTDRYAQLHAKHQCQGGPGDP